MTTEIKVLRIKPDEIDKYWKRVFPFIREGMIAQQSEFHVEHVRLLILQGLFVLLALEERGTIVGALVLEPVQFSGWRAMRVQAIEGTDMPRIMKEAWPVLDKWAASSGVSFFETWSPGTETSGLRDSGFEKVYELARRPVPELE